MENLHEQIKAYIPKLEYSIREYMRNPATPNAAQGIMAMVECLNMLKGAEGAICTGREMTKADAEAWADHMVNEDGTTGPHWGVDQTTAIAESMGMTWEKVSRPCWWITMNMMYSDYSGVAEKYGVSAAQLCIRYAIQLGTVALPKTADFGHMKSNADVDFVISEEDMQTLLHMERIADYGAFNVFPVFSGKPLA